MATQNFITELIEHLDEQVRTITNDEENNIFRVQLHDGITITKIGNSVFTEDGFQDWIESTYRVWEELDADIAQFRDQ